MTTENTKSSVLGSKPKAPIGALGNIARESAGFGAAEMVSMGVSFGVFAVADALIPKGSSPIRAISKVCVEPYLDKIENLMSKCHIEECKIDHTKSREERAESYTKTITIFGAAWAASMAAKVWSRRATNAAFGVAGEKHAKLGKDASLFKKALNQIPFVNWSNEERLILAVDEGVHIGSLIYMNTKGADVTDAHIKSTSKILQKIGFNKERADNAAAMFHVWEVPNFMGMVAGFGTIFGKHAYGWPTKHEHQGLKSIFDGTAESKAFNRSIT